jgi:carboxyl-terminal processing protease
MLLFFIGMSWAQETIPIAQKLIEETYGDEISDNELECAAINGMLENIEMQTGLSGSQALTLAEHQKNLEWQMGIREGYGLRVALLPGRGFLVENVLADGPAEIAGIQQGDVIISLADHPFTGLQPEQMLHILHQEYEDIVPVDVVREDELRRFNVKKGRFKLQLISEQEALTIHFFGRGVSEQLKVHLERKLNQPMVIDLRDNEGGVWDEAVSSLDYFLPAEEIIGYRRTMDGLSIPMIGKIEQVHNAPLIVLINQGTKGPAELFAISLQEHRRATILGVTSAGEASDFREHKLGEDMIMKLVDTEILSPQKGSWTGQGVEPNILIRQNIALPAYGSSSSDMQLETALRLISESK